MNGIFSFIFIKYFSAKRESRGNDAFYRCNVMSIDCQARENRLAVSDKRGKIYDRWRARERHVFGVNRGKICTSSLRRIILAFTLRLSLPETKINRRFPICEHGDLSLFSIISILKENRSISMSEHVIVFKRVGSKTFNRCQARENMLLVSSGMKLNAIRFVWHLSVH